MIIDVLIIETRWFVTLSLSYNSGGVCEITLNRPEVLNRFDNQLQIDLARGMGIHCGGYPGEGGGAGVDEKGTLR